MSWQEELRSKWRLGLGLLVLASGCAAEQAGSDGVLAESPSDGGVLASGTGGASAPSEGQDLVSGSGAVSASSGGSLAIARDAEEAPDPTAGVAGSAGAPSQEIATNPFVLVAHDPLSTFGADVDTASYDLFRSYVATHRSLPPPSQVRLEEFINSFAYDYAAPALDAVEPFAIHLDASPNLVSRDTTVLRVGIQGKVLPPEEKKPANLVFLVDVSGSMQEELPLVQDMARKTLDLLDPEDSVAIVTYAGNFDTPLGATPVAEKDAILSAIEGLTSGGGTNGEGGIQAAYAQAEAAFIEGGINHIVILTDGDFNIGLSSVDELERLVVEKRKSGVTLTVVGFGFGNTKDDIMERIANAGNGIYGYVGDANDVTRYVEERMLQTLQHIAKDVKLQVEFNPEYVHAYRLLGYENRDIADEDFRDDVIDAGEIGSGHRVTALYELVLSGESIPEREGAPSAESGADFSGTVEVDPADLVLVKVRYKQPGAAESDAASEVSASLGPAAVSEGLAGAASDLQWAVAVASFAEILKGSPYADREAIEAIGIVLEEQASQSSQRGEFADLFELAVPLLP